MNTRRMTARRSVPLRFSLWFWLAACLFIGISVLSLASAQTGFEMIKKVPIPGQGGWDYLTVDDAARRLYVSHGTQVEVLDVDSLQMVGTIPKTPGVHGIAIASDLGRGFISNGQANNVTIFDLKTLKPLGEVPTGQKPDAIIYDPATSRVFASTAVATAPPRLMPRRAKLQERSTWEAGRSSPLKTARAMSTTIWKMRVRWSRSTPVI